MKKRYYASALVVLALTMSACGSSSGSTSVAGVGSEASTVSASEKDEPLTRKDTAEGDTPLTREDATEKKTEAASEPDEAARGISIEEALSSNTIWANQDEEIKQELMAEAKKQGGEISFGSDGTTKIVDKDGTVSIQNADGSWNFRNQDGSASQFGGDWPENDFTKLVPKPSFRLMASDTSDTEFNVLFSDADIGAIREYALKVKDSGFDKNETVTDQELQGTAFYSYEASNGKGYRIKVFSSANASGMTISKEQGYGFETCLLSSLAL